MLTSVCNLSYYSLSRGRGYICELETIDYPREKKWPIKGNLPEDRWTRDHLLYPDNSSQIYCRHGSKFCCKALLKSTFTLEGKHISYISPILQEQWEKFKSTTNARDRGHVWSQKVPVSRKWCPDRSDSYLAAGPKRHVQNFINSGACLQVSWLLNTTKVLGFWFDKDNMGHCMVN